MSEVKNAVFPASLVALDVKRCAKGVTGRSYRKEALLELSGQQKEAGPVTPKRVGSLEGCWPTPRYRNI